MFPSLTFDTVTVTNAKFLIYPNQHMAAVIPTTPAAQTRAWRIDDNIGGDITIGMDVLRRLRLYVAYGELKLYVTPATAAAQLQMPASNETLPARQVDLVSITALG